MLERAATPRRRHGPLRIDFQWIVYVINKGTNGLELLSVLVTNNIIGEASRIGFGSTLAAIPTLIVYFTLQRQFVRGLTLGATKG